jgi:hypothetical protein
MRWPNSAIRTSVWLCVLTLLSAIATAQTAPVVLSATQPINFNLAAGSYTSGIAFDIPAGTTRFKLDLNSPGADTDLFVRFGDPFPARNAFGQPLSFFDVFDFAQHSAIGSTGTESLLVSDANIRKVQAGRYFVNVLNSSNVDTSATLRLTLNSPATPTNIQVRFNLPCSPNDVDCKCDLAPWNNSSTAGFVSPGNPGLTLGQKRRNVVLAAAQQIAQTLSSEQTITIQACWDKLGVDPSKTTLASAGPSAVAANSISGFTFRMLPQSNTFFVGAAAARFSGTPGCSVFGGDCDRYADIQIIFNESVDIDGLSNGGRFYYGINPIAAGSRDTELFSVALHEIVHGLGYTVLIDEDGDELAGLDDAYSSNLVWADGTQNRLFSRLTNAERRIAQSSNSLFWIGANGLAQSGIVGTPSEPGVKVHAPFEFDPGASVSHLDGNRYATQLMAPRYAAGTRSLGLAAGQLQDVGWKNPAPIAPSPRIYPGNWFDPRRSGHGIDIQPIANIDGTSFNKMLLTFYTYDQNGDPEYYISTGPIVDGQFIPDTNYSTNAASSLGRYFVRNGQISVDPNFNGKLRLDLLDGPNSAPCTEPGRSPPAIAMNALFVANRDVSNWCMVPLLDRAFRPSTDFSGHWYAPGDGGWGISVVNARVNNQNLLNILLYYPDAQGNPRWAFAQTDSFVSGQTLELKQRKGYCRNCAFVEPVDTVVGSMILKLNQVEGTTGGDNEMTFNVNFRGAAGGNFSRSNAKIARLAERPRELQ